MQIPERLEDWTLARIEEILSSGACEGDTFDFKERLPHPKNDADKLHLRKTVVAFANSRGGFLVYGVKDDRTLPAKDRIVGIPVTTDFSQHFGAFFSDCEPSIEWRVTAPIKIPNTASAIFLAEVESTWRKPHALLQADATYFVKRTNKGNESMSFAEISGAFRESEFRRSGLALLISELEHMRSTAEKLIQDSTASGNNTNAHADRLWTWAVRYSTMLLDTALGNTHPFFSADPELWKLLCTIRERARSSNAMSEAFSGVIFFRITDRVDIHDSRTRPLIDCAKEIVTASKEAVERLRKLQ